MQQKILNPFDVVFISKLEILLKVLKAHIIFRYHYFSYLNSN